MAENSKSVKIVLEHDLQINGVKIPAGSQDVPANVAEDWKRMDKEASQEEANHHHERKYSGAMN